MAAIHSPTIHSLKTVLYLLSFEAFNDGMYSTNIVSFDCSPGIQQPRWFMVCRKKKKKKKKKSPTTPPPFFGQKASFLIFLNPFLIVLAYHFDSPLYKLFHPLELFLQWLQFDSPVSNFHLIFNDLWVWNNV